jgi:hypothetical protein
LSGDRALGVAGRDLAVVERDRRHVRAGDVVARLDRERRGARRAHAGVDDEQDRSRFFIVDDVGGLRAVEGVGDRVEALDEVQPLHEQCAHC